MWWSAVEGRWFDINEIVQGRQGMPDTYTSEANVPTFRSHSLTLGGMVGVNFYCDLSVLDEEEREAAYVEFELDGETTKADYKADFTNEEKTCHGFTCPVRSVQMADTITATLHYGDGKTVSNTFSVRRYVDYVDKHRGGYDQKVLDLVAAIADYGHYMQPFLAAGAGWTVGRDYRAMPAAAEIAETAIAEAKGYAAPRAIAVSGDTSAVAQLTYSLVLDAKTGIHVYVRPASGSQGVSASVQGGDLPVTVEDLADGRYRVTLENIPAHQLGDERAIDIAVGGKVLTVQVSPYSYVRDVLGSDSGAFGSTAAHEAVTSLYLYYKATMAYRGEPISAS